LLLPAGLKSFSGSNGVSHTFGYKHPEDYRGLRVLVTGCAISSVEIASDLATLGAARVVLTNRRQRYVLPKLVSGVPLDLLAFTRFSALSKESFPMVTVGTGFKQFVLAVAGSPEQFGAPKPADDFFEAGITMSQFFLPLVAEDASSSNPGSNRSKVKLCGSKTAAPKTSTASSSVPATICIFRF
jgi:hypothetical protein